VVFKCCAVDKKTLPVVGAKNSYELWSEIQDLPKLRFLLPYPFLGALEFFNVEVYPDPIQ
jgi:hypothetical protein